MRKKVAAWTEHHSATKADKVLPLSSIALCSHAMRITGFEDHYQWGLRKERISKPLRDSKEEHWLTKVHFEGLLRMKDG
jgi:hypothetical protein